MATDAVTYASEYDAVPALPSFALDRVGYLRRRRRRGSATMRALDLGESVATS